MKSETRTKPVAKKKAGAEADMEEVSMESLLSGVGQKERQRKEKQRDKEVKKADRKREKALRPPGSPEDEIEIVHVEGGTTDEGASPPASRSRRGTSASRRRTGARR